MASHFDGLEESYEWSMVDDDREETASVGTFGVARFVDETDRYVEPDVIRTADHLADWFRAMADAAIDRGDEEFSAATQEANAIAEETDGAGSFTVVVNDVEYVVTVRASG